MGSRIAEIGQHPVAHVFGDEPVEPSNDLGDGTMVGADEVAQILGVETRGQRCGPDEIAKHDGQLPPLGFGRDPCSCGFRGSSRMAARWAAIGGRAEWNWI